MGGGGGKRVGLGWGGGEVIPGGGVVRAISMFIEKPSLNSNCLTYIESTGILINFIYTLLMLACSDVLRVLKSTVSRDSDLGAIVFCLRIQGRHTVPKEIYFP